MRNLGISCHMQGRFIAIRKPYFYIQNAVIQTQLHNAFHSPCYSLDKFTSDIRVGNVGLLVSAEHRDGGICLWWQDVYQGVAVLMQGNTSGRLQQFTVES